MLRAQGEKHLIFPFFNYLTKCFLNFSKHLNPLEASSDCWIPPSPLIPASDSVGLGWGHIVGISSKVPGNANASSPDTDFEDH